jgi:hypothetical protein
MNMATLQKKNPLKLNKLQLRTLALAQKLAQDADQSTRDDATGNVSIGHLPHAHGNHIHIGDVTVSVRDASGFDNASVWNALERKGLAAKNITGGITLTPDALIYVTGFEKQLFSASDH